MKRKKLARVQNKRPERIKKRIPTEARERIHQGGAHQDKARYSRKEKHREQY